MSEQPESDSAPAVPSWRGPTELIYANSLALNGGPFDVVLVFGVQQPLLPGNLDEDPPPPTQETVRVAMSWGHAKSMIPLMARMVAEYEQKFGEVPSPGFGDTWRA